MKSFWAFLTLWVFVVLVAFDKVHGVEKKDQGPSGAKKPNEGPNADTVHMPSEDTSAQWVCMRGLADKMAITR